jgi:hypothetical protein
MFYVALDTVERHIERVTRRATRGGHSASESTLRRIHASSLSNLPAALIPDKSGIEIVQIYDNSRSESWPGLVLETRRGRIIRLADSFPQWLQQALGWTERDLERQRRKLTELRGRTKITGEMRAESDVDITVEFEPGVRDGLIGAFSSLVWGRSLICGRLAIGLFDLALPAITTVL